VSFVASDHVNRFSETIERRLGLLFAEDKLESLAELLHRRLGTLGLPPEAYLRALDRDDAKAELRALALELTVGETYFFRNAEQFQALIETVLPDRMRARGSDRPLRILSAACATGEEAYSIAIAAQESMESLSCRISIRAVDVNPAAVAKATEARYSLWSLRDTDAGMRRRWFGQHGREVKLDKAALAAEMVFEERNLASEDPDLWRPGAYDVIFCRNVLMYFSPGQARAVMARIARALAPGGYLFLGHAETVRGLSDDFHLRHTHGAFYYQAKAEHDRREGLALAAVARPGDIARSPEAFSEAWFDVIRESSERIGALAGGRRRLAPAGLVASPCSRDLTPALDLMRRERFTDALASVRVVTAEPGADSDSLLLEAILLAQSGDLGAAEAACRRLLEVDGLNAGAHYVYALCRESAGDMEAAAEHDRIAVYLDADFAIPRLHLGLLARTKGDLAAGRRELASALALLQREDPARLMLFGGGFNREALIALCRSALRSCGGEG